MNSTDRPHSNFSKKLSSVSPYILDSDFHPYKSCEKEDGKIKEIESDIQQIQSFNILQLYQYLAIFKLLRQTYSIDFNPALCNYYVTQKDFDNSAIFLQPCSRLLFLFLEQPSHCVDNNFYINLTLNKHNDRLIYMYGLFRYKTQDSYFIDRLGDEFKRVYERALVEQDFNVLKTYLVLDQFPSFTVFFQDVISYFKTQIKLSSDRSVFFLPKNLEFLHDRSMIANQISKSRILSSYFNLFLSDQNQIYTVEQATYDDAMIESLTLQLKKIDKAKIGTYHTKNMNYYKFPLQTPLYNLSDILSKRDSDLILSAFYFFSFAQTVSEINQTDLHKSYIDRLKNLDIEFLKESTTSLLQSFLKPYFFSLYSLNTSYSRIYSPFINDKNYSSYFSSNTTVESEPEFSSDIYYPPYTLSQFYSLINVYNRKKDLHSLINKIVFYWQKNKSEAYSTMEHVLEKQATIGNDLAVFNSFREIHSQNKPNTSYDRKKQRIDDLNSFRFFDKLSVTESFTYLDFGGGNGELTSGIADYLHLQKSNTFVSDVKSWFSSDNLMEHQQKVTFRYLKSSLLPFANGFFNFISAFQVFHHIKNMDVTLREINRVLKINGILLIREHDCDSMGTRVLIDVEHTIRECSIDEIQNISILHDYDDKYYSLNEMTMLIEKYGFKMVKLNYPSARGVTRFYYRVFIKVNDL